MNILNKTALVTAALLLAAPVALAQDNGTMMKKSDGGAMMKKGDKAGGMSMKKKPADGTGEGKGTATGGNSGGQAGRT